MSDPTGLELIQGVIVEREAHPDVLERYPREAGSQTRIQVEANAFP